MTRTVTRSSQALCLTDSPSTVASIRYLGMHIGDTSVAGETKADGVIPAHPGSGALRVSQDLWAIFFATLDPRGWDANRSIVYQLRKDGPTGRIVKEGVIARSRDDWDPFGDGQRLFMSCGMPIAFGVPHGAMHNGRPMANANVFAVKWYRWAHRLVDGQIQHPSHHRQAWPLGLQTKHRTLRVEWMQFRLNDAGDDLQPLTEPAMLRQRGYENGEAFCALGPDLQMNHSMKAPVATDATCTTWIECDSFIPYHLGNLDHHAIAPVKFAFNFSLGLYEWVSVGPLTEVPGRVIGEASVNLHNGTWVIAARSFEYAGRPPSTCWFKTSDLMAGLGEPTFTNSGAAPRTAFVCGDGVLRLFTNDTQSAGSPTDRSRLCCWDVDPETFELTNKRVILDARQAKLPMEDPFVDMAKLCPAQGNRQLLLFRCIDHSHTGNKPCQSSQNDAGFALAGIHAAQFTYSEPTPEVWCFD